MTRKLLKAYLSSAHGLVINFREVDVPDPRMRNQRDEAFSQRFVSDSGN